MNVNLPPFIPPHQACSANSSSPIETLVQLEILKNIRSQSLLPTPEKTPPPDDSQWLAKIDLLFSEMKNIQSKLTCVADTVVSIQSKLSLSDNKEDLPTQRTQSLSLYEILQHFTTGFPQPTSNPSEVPNISPATPALSSSTIPPSSHTPAPTPTTATETTPATV